MEAEGGHIPALDLRPKLHEDLKEDFDIFIDLSKNRQWDSMAGTPHSIQFSEIESYMHLYEIEDPDRRLLKRLVFMDQIYCEHYRKNHGGHTDTPRRDESNRGRRKT